MDRRTGGSVLNNGIEDRGALRAGWLQPLAAALFT